jgi:hypothetical protein
MGEQPITPKESIKGCDFFAGWLSGVGGVLTGAPFDAVKTKQQHLDIGFADGAYTIKRLDGYLGFFRGTALPLVFNGVVNISFYAIYGKVLDYVNRPTGVDAWVRNEKIHDKPHLINDPAFVSKGVAHNIGKMTEPPQKPNGHIGTFLIAGAIANIAQLLIVCPVEVVKVRQQAYGSLVGGSIQCLRGLYRGKGIRGLYKGLFPLAVRNVGGGVIQGLAYTSIMNYRHPDEKSHTWGDVWFAGGMAGMISWWVVAPFDVIKTKIQADEEISPKYKGTIDCTQKMYKSQGIVGLFRGILPLSLPAFIVNGASFLVYNYAYDMCNGNAFENWKSF